MYRITTLDRLMILLMQPIHCFCHKGTLLVNGQLFVHQDPHVLFWQAAYQHSGGWGCSSTTSLGLSNACSPENKIENKNTFIFLKIQIFVQKSRGGKKCWEFSCKKFSFDETAKFSEKKQQQKTCVRQWIPFSSMGQMNGMHKPEISPWRDRN